MSFWKQCLSARDINARPFSLFPRTVTQASELRDGERPHSTPDRSSPPNSLRTFAPAKKRRQRLAGLCRKNAPDCQTRRFKGSGFFRSGSFSARWLCTTSSSKRLPMKVARSGISPGSGLRRPLATTISISGHRSAVYRARSKPSVDGTPSKGSSSRPNQDQGRSPRGDLQNVRRWRWRCLTPR